MWRKIFSPLTRVTNRRFPRVSVVTYFPCSTRHMSIDTRVFWGINERQVLTNAPPKSGLLGTSRTGKQSGNVVHNDLREEPKPFCAPVGCVQWYDNTSLRVPRPPRYLAPRDWVRRRRRRWRRYPSTPTRRRPTWGASCGCATRRRPTVGGTASPPTPTRRMSRRITVGTGCCAGWRSRREDTSSSGGCSSAWSRRSSRRGSERR